MQSRVLVGYWFGYPAITNLGIALNYLILLRYFHRYDAYLFRQIRLFLHPFLFYCIYLVTEIVQQVLNL